jgi:hypothetical protein
MSDSGFELHLTQEIILVLIHYPDFSTLKKKNLSHTFQSTTRALNSSIAVPVIGSFIVRHVDAFSQNYSVRG